MYFHRKLLQDVLHQNKKVKQEKGRHRNQETGDLTQQSQREFEGLWPPGPSTRKNRLEQEDVKCQQENLQEKKEAAHPIDLTK